MARHSGASLSPRKAGTSFLCLRHRRCGAVNSAAQVCGQRLTSLGWQADSLDLCFIQAVQQSASV
eukprot:9699045-Alexandrium_andersonii.AAC.1